MYRFSNANMLLAFVTVAREGSVSQAAEVLNLTQPAVSYQIKRLSEETGVTLFQRSSAGLQITHDGAALLGKAKAALEALKDFHRAAQRRTGRVGGTVRIGTIVDPEFIRLGRLLGALHQAYPNVQTELQHGVSGDIPKRLKRGRIDAGFFLSSSADPVIYDAEADVSLRAMELARFDYRVIGPAGWQDRIAHADWPSLAAMPWIGTPSISSHNRLLAQVFSQHKCTQNVVALVDQEASMMEMVRAGVGLSLCRASNALHEKQAFGLAIAEDVSIPACLSFVTRDQEEANPTLAAVLGLVKETWL